jgi:hypothetical protein
MKGEFNINKAYAENVSGVVFDRYINLVYGAESTGLYIILDNFVLNISTRTH